MWNPFNFSPFRSRCMRYAAVVVVVIRKYTQSDGDECVQINRNEHKKHEQQTGATTKKEKKTKRKSKKEGLKIHNDKIVFRLVLCSKQRTLFKWLTVNHEWRDLKLNWRCKTKGCVCCDSTEIESWFAASIAKDMHVNFCRWAQWFLCYSFTRKHSPFTSTVKLLVGCLNPRCRKIQ